MHTLVEKPLAATSAAAQRIQRAFAEAGLVGGVGHIERYNPALASLRHRMAAGELGAVFQVVTRRQGPFPARINDVGVVLDLATHDIDLTAWVGGGAYTSVAARTAHRTGRATEDLVSVVGTLETGAIVNHSVNWVSPVKERSVSVTGEAGAFVADLLTADLTFYANGSGPAPWGPIASFPRGHRGRRHPASPWPSPNRWSPSTRRSATPYSAVVDQTRAQGATVSMADAARTVATAEAVLESARTGSTVKL